jgi:hypothetical protein
MGNAIPPVFLGQPTGGDINLGAALRGFEGGLIGRLLPGGVGGGGIATQMAPSDNPTGGSGGVTTLRYPHD